MHEHNSQRAPIAWVLIADGKQAQIYECKKTVQKVPLAGANKHHYCDEKADHELMPVLNGVMDAETIDGYQIGHDRRGTASSSNSPTHNTYEPHGDITTELKRRFTKLITDKLQKAYEQKLFQVLVLVAPPHMIGELKEHLSADLQKQVVATLPKDLMQYHGQILMTHLRDTLVEASAA